MKIVEVFVPAVDKVYDFRLAEQASVEELVDEIIEMICQREQCTLAGEAGALSLWRAATNMLLLPNTSLSAYGISNGERLILV